MSKAQNIQKMREGEAALGSTRARGAALVRDVGAVRCGRADKFIRNRRHRQGERDESSQEAGDND